MHIYVLIENILKVLDEISSVVNGLVTTQNDNSQINISDVSKYIDR